MQAIYSYLNKQEGTSINQAEKELYHSIDKSYDLYHLLFSLIIDISNYAEQRIDKAKNKRLPSEEDLNPNTRFIDNKIIRQIRVNNQLIKYLEIKKLNWVDYSDIIKGLYTNIVESELYEKYMQAPESKYTDDKKFIAKVFEEIIAPYEPLYKSLEEQSIYWNDEPEFIIGIIVKTIQRFKEAQGEEARLMPLFTNSDDEEFPKKLFRKTILNRNEYSELIKQFCKNWDFDRIAFMDLLLMQMAIAEVLTFSSIPTRVTINEYIELSKYYSTNKSNIFINGLLDKVFKHLKDNNQIVKQGRGLIGDDDAS